MSGRSNAAAALLLLLTIFGSRLPGTIGALCLWPALGVFPGMALAMLLARRDPRAVRWLLGLTLSPVVTSAAWLLTVTSCLRDANGSVILSGDGARPPTVTRAAVGWNPSNATRTS